MKTIKTLILRTAGTNCDKETAHAFEKAGSKVEYMHINALLKNKNALEKYQILAIPGGFTYGDDVASGKVLANELKFGMKKQLSKFVRDGKLIIGICNGFQVLVKMGLLPKIDGMFNVDATLSLNDSGIFTDKWVHLKGDNKSKCIWTKDLPDVIDVPIAHAEGKFMPKSQKILKAMKDNGQVVFRYTSKCGNGSGAPFNPNGSIDDIAGICDSSGRILGMMPHPERHMTYLQHPNWRRASDKERKSMGIGLKLFENGVKYAQEKL